MNQPIRNFTKHPSGLFLRATFGQHTPGNPWVKLLRQCPQENINFKFSVCPTFFKSGQEMVFNRFNFSSYYADKCSSLQNICAREKTILQKKAKTTTTKKNQTSNIHSQFIYIFLLPCGEWISKGP